MQTVGGIKLIPALIVSAFAFAIAKASADTEANIQNIMDKMTMAEKQAMCHGDGQMHGGGCPRLGIGRITMTDGPLGVRRIPPSTGFGSGLIVAQTWNADLHYEYGLVLGKETSEDGADMLLGPGMNIVRDLVSGRTFEYFTEDPFLNGKTASKVVQGIQSQGVAATLKPFLCNNTEKESGTRSDVDHKDDFTG